MAAPQKDPTGPMEYVPVAGADVSGADALPYYIAALLPSGTPRWNDQSSIGSPATVTYSFMTESPSYAWFDDSFGFAPMSGDTAERRARRTGDMGGSREHHVQGSIGCRRWR